MENRDHGKDFRSVIIVYAVGGAVRIVRSHLMVAN